MKLAIWITTLVGLAPAVLLSILHLGMHIALSRQLANEPDFGDGDAITIANYVSLEGGRRLEVATSYCRPSACWPAPCCWWSDSCS